MPLIAINGTLLNYDLSGPSGAPVVAFSNSLGTGMAMWDGVVPSLRGRYRILRYDTRGHGGSQTRDEPASIGDLAGDLLGLLDALGIARAHLVGLSLGGMTVQALASAEPDRVLSLTLMATAAHLPSEASWNERAATVRAEGTGAIVEATLGRWFTPGFAERAPDLVGPVRDGFVATDDAGYAICCGAIAGMDLRPVLRWITAPTLVIAGRDDPATPPAMAEEICAGIRWAELVVIPRAAHLLAVERAEVASAHLLGFLDRHRGPSVATGAVPFASGVANRRSVLGEAHVARSLDRADGFSMPWQDFITRTAWGEIWGDARLPWKTRSLVTLAMMVALGREEEFKLHIDPALRNGVDLGELQALLLQTAIYAGVPAANGAFRWVRDVLGEGLDDLETKGPANGTGEMGRTA
ncbi:3-oxoadipate enol-lactonase [Methylobacterium sp. J-068]|uniref:bifunctional 3-oxoadipate enol-lactonase/4-carboxymuconolactone decarboxylase PcaDC n=1 Tax=Methylobacterium sp. J-068 TaxID=2836649 RepID=UPI001FB88E6C|nr:3-oxoadipate enol-lactonase [Methylobacterium sp. J-068]MCJ2032815.1 3-oxoadipate enol-lactonase [Methylobacterium sp. J-068]